MRRAASSSPATRAPASRSTRPLPVGFRERRREHAAEHRDARRARARRRRAAMPPLRNATDARPRSRIRPRGEVDSRHAPGGTNDDQQQSRHDEEAPLDPRGAGRAPQVGAVEDLLQHLRVHLDAGNALAQRRRLEVEQAQPGDADQHQLVCGTGRGPPCRQHLARRKRSAPDRGAPIAQPDRAVGLRRDADVADRELEQARRAAASMRRAALPIATRIISSVSAGATVAGDVASSGTRRTTRSVASELIRPRPAAARSSSSQAAEPPAKRRSSGGAPRDPAHRRGAGRRGKRGSGASRPAMASTTLRPRIACGEPRVVARQGAQLGAPPTPAGSGISAASAPARSGRARRSSRSTPIAAGPARRDARDQLGDLACAARATGRARVERRSRRSRR